MECCLWCESKNIETAEDTVYWELPDGTRAIKITETPTILCRECMMKYQIEETVKAIEDQLFLVDRKSIDNEIAYNDLMKMPRLLKKNYFDFG